MCPPSPELCVRPHGGPYDPAKIEEYHEAYAGEGKRNASTAVRRLARGWS